MKGKKLMAHEVISRRQRFGNHRLPVEVLQHFGSAPVPAAERWCSHAFLINLRESVRSAFTKSWTGIAYLEPLLSTAITALVVTGALVHPDHDGPLLMRPLAPNCLDFATGSHLGHEIR